MTLGSDTPTDLADVVDASPESFFQVLQQRYRLGDNFTFLGHNAMLFVNPPKLVVQEYLDMVLKNRRVTEALATIHRKPGAVIDESSGSSSSLVTPAMSPEGGRDSTKTSPTPVVHATLGRQGSLKIYDKKPGVGTSMKTLRRANSQHVRRSKRSRLSAGISPQDLESGGLKSSIDLSDLQLFMNNPKSWRDYPHICGLMNMVFRRMLFEKKYPSFSLSQLFVDGA